MPWNGSGSYGLPAATFPEVQGTVIDANRYNPTLTDIQTGLNNALAKDGQNSAVANLPMGGFKHTGAADGTGAGNYMSWAQLTASSGAALIGFMQSGGGAVGRTVQEKSRDIVSVKDFGALLDGTTNDTAAVLAACTALNGTGKRLTFDGPSCKLVTTISLNNFSGFVIDFMMCSMTCAHAAGVYVFDATQTGQITFLGGLWTGTANANHFIKTKGSASAQATTFPTVPAENQWSRQLRFYDQMFTGFATVFDLQNFSREIFIEGCYATGNVTAIKRTGKVVNLFVDNSVLYSRVAASQALVTRGDAGDTAYRYSEGGQFNDVIADTSGVAVDNQDFFVDKWNGGQIRSPAGTNALQITKGITGLSRDFWYRDVLWNGNVAIGTGLAAQFLFEGTLHGVWQSIQGTAITAVSYVKGLTVQGQFDAPSGIPVAMAVGANCVGIDFSPDFVDAAYTTILTVDSTSLSGTRANFVATFTPTLAFGGGSTGITYGVQTGRYQWNGSYITGSFQITLTAKGSSTGAAMIGGLPFAALVNGTVQIGKYSAFNTAITPFGDIASGATSMSLKTAGGGSEVAILDTAFSATSIINGSFSYAVS